MSEVAEKFRGAYRDGSTGHQGDASEASELLRRKALAPCLALVRESGAEGLTVKEYRERYGIHHGVASSRLSNLHALGRIVKLKQRRDGCGIYVLPELAGDRPTVPRRHNPHGTVREVVRVVPAPVEAPVEVVREVRVETVRPVEVTRREILAVIRAWQKDKMRGAAFGVESLADAVVAFVAAKGKEQG